MITVKHWFASASRRRTLGVLVAVAVVGVALIAAMPASGGPARDLPVLRLHVDPTTGVLGFTDGVLAQPVTVGDRGCDIDPASEDLVTLSAGTGGGVKGPGVVSYGIGVKSGGSNGTPCSQIDSTETLIIISNAPDPWTRLSLDLELKGNADVTATLYKGSITVGTYELVTGRSIEAGDPPPEPGFPYEALSTGEDRVTCASQSDSGPDSGPNDNCYWTIDPGGAFFDRIELTTVVGTVSLEGGADFADAFPDLDRDSIFYYRVLCGDETASDLDGAVSGSFTSLADPQTCKRYTLDANQTDGGTVTFQPEGTAHVFYRAFLEFGDVPGAIMEGETGLFKIGLKYDPDDDGPLTYRPLLACNNPTIVDGLVTDAEIPVDETWCIASFGGTATSSGRYGIVWQVYGSGDPRFRTG